jgi:hypothetical protein
MVASDAASLIHRIAENEVSCARHPMTLRLLFLLLLVCLFPGLAHAQDGSATSATAARALFGEGVAAADAEDWATAAERFGRALSLRPSPTIALNLGVALEHLGRLVEAAEVFRGVARDGAASVDVRASATESLAALEPRIAWVRLSVEGPLEGVRFSVDERSLAAALVGTSVPLDPGPHRFVASREDLEVASVSLSLAEGGREEAHLSIPARVEPPVEEIVVVDETPAARAPVDEAPAAPLEIPLPPSGPDPLALGLGIGGGVLVVGGVVALVLVFALPSANMPFTGNAGLVEVGR